jgi:hypothetical protein
MRMKIDKDAPFFRTLLESYKQTKSFTQSRIRQDKTTEDAISKDYTGREIYELLQNAEDEGAEFIKIILNTNEKCLIIQNGGETCNSFSEEGFSSIMMAGMSPKRASKNKRNYIGNKGLGFRSLLNWAESVSIVSSGIRCTFSLEIANQYWAEIKQSLDPQLALDHQEFAKREFNTDCPLAIFAIPKVENATYDGFVTSIEIRYKEDSLAGIQSQIRSLSGKVLLFLKHIISIEISVDEQKTTIRRENKRKDTCTPALSFLTTFDQGHINGQEWVVFNLEDDLSENQKYGIGVAYDSYYKESGEYIYSFFPTQVRLSLPCVIHATFELNSSRNGIIQSSANQIIKDKIADVLLEFAEQLANNNSNKETSWNYYDLLSLTDNQDFSDLASRLQREKLAKKVYPTIGNGYCTLEQTCRYSDSWATFVKDKWKQSFSNHLISGFEDRDIPSQSIDISLSKLINNISTQINKDEYSFSERCELIKAVTSIQPSPKVHNLQLLVDDHNKLIEDEAHMNVGESIQNLPENIGIVYVNSNLADELIRILSIDDSNKRRGLTKKLKDYSSVSDMDVNQVKRKIVSFSKDKMNKDSYNQLMRALFKKYSESNTGKEEVKKIASNPDFRLLNKDGEKRFPSELVLEDKDIDTSIYGNEYLLKGDVNFWKEQFKSSDSNGYHEDELDDFFFSTLGVSSVVPMKLVPIDDKSIDFLEHYSTSYPNVVSDPSAYYSSKLAGESEFYNLYKVPSEDFLCSFIKTRSCAKLIEIMIFNEPLFEIINNCKIYYQFRKIKDETTKISFAQYCLSKYECLEPLRSYFVSEGIYLGSDDKLEEILRQFSSKPSFARNLILLGAKEDLTHINVNDLYGLLKKVPEIRMQQGVQKLYKALREALLKHENDSEFEQARADFVANGKLYARQNGKLDVYPVKNVYYWDNDHLPKQFLTELPKLEIGNRVGEDSVHRVFGVQLSKELEIQLNSAASKEIKLMTEALNRHFNERIRFLLAYRTLNTKENLSSIKNYTNSLKNTYFRIYSKCSFIKGEISIDLQDGEMISSNEPTGTFFHICTNHLNFQDAISDPKFCENITEAICIVLKVTGSEITNCFRSIVSHPIEYTKYISEKDISEDDWKKADRYLGISEHEKLFWEKVFKLAKKDFNPESISGGLIEKQKYLQSVFPEIQLPTPLKDVADLSPIETYKLMISLCFTIPELDSSVLGNDAIKEYYSLWMTDKLSSLSDKFKCWAYDCINDLGGDTIIPYRFYDICNRFANGEWAEELVDENHILSEAELEEKLMNITKKEFQGFSPKDQITRAINVRQEYETILKDYNLTLANIDRKDLCLTLFDGDKYLRLFEENVKRIAESNDEYFDEKNLPPKDEFMGIKYGQAKTVTLDINSQPKARRKTGGRYKSDKELFLLGQSAEKKVFQAMKGNEMYSEVIGCSRNLDTINGDDNKHYDILYKKVGDDQYRYLEVKTKGPQSIIMSSLEYEFAMKNKDRYDFALVDDKQIYIIETPFLQNDGHDALKVFPESYYVPLEITQDF